MFREISRFEFILSFLQSVSLLVAVVDYDRVGGNEMIGEHEESHSSVAE